MFDSIGQDGRHRPPCPGLGGPIELPFFDVAEAWTEDLLHHGGGIDHGPRVRPAMEALVVVSHLEDFVPGKSEGAERAHDERAIEKARPERIG